jgi:hypothetical protein
VTAYDINQFATAEGVAGPSGLQRGSADPGEEGERFFLSPLGCTVGRYPTRLPVD